MSTELMDAPVAADPFDGGLDQFTNPTPAEQKAPPVEVKEPVQPARAEEKPTVEVKTEAPDLLSGIADDAPAQVEDEETKEYPPEIRTIKAREHFDALKTSKKAAERRALELETKVKDLEARGGVKAPEVAVLTKERDEWKSKWEAVQKDFAATRIELTEEFKNKVTIPKSEATTELIMFRDGNSLPKADLDAALSEPDRVKRNVLLSELAELIPGKLNQEDFYAAAKKFIEASKVEEELYNNADGSIELAEKRKAEEEAASKLKSAEEYKSARQAVIDNLSTKLTDLKKDPSVWEKIVADAEGVDFDSLPPKMKAFAAVAMNSIKPYQEVVTKQNKEIERLNGIISSRNAATPGAAAGSSTKTTEAKGDFLDGLPTIR